MFGPSELGLELKERDREAIIENLTEHDGDDLSHLNLAGANFAESSCRGADLRGSDLRAATFSRAVLAGADMRGADASDALIEYAGACVRACVCAWRLCTCACACVHVRACMRMCVRVLERESRMS